MDIEEMAFVSAELFIDDMNKKIKDKKLDENMTSYYINSVFNYIKTMEIENTFERKNKGIKG